MAAAKGNDRSQAQQLLVQALAQARRTGNATQQARLQLVQAQVAMVLGEHASAAPLLDLVLAQAHQAGAARLEAAVRANRADLALNLKQPRAALADAQAGLPIAERLGERRMQRVLQHNAMLARVALGERHSAQHDLEALQEAWGAEGNTGMQVATLREYADALADAGDAAAALTVHHRERALSRQLSEANRTAALTELRGRYDREAQQREIRLLASDNAVKAAELMQQTLARRLWLLGGSALALALALTALLVLRVRETNRQLEHSRARLRLQSERDALTGLANRRHFQTVLQQSIAASPDGGLQGALLMLDIDHFKQINDGHGHAAGDAVLVEVARRIADSLREADTVARWGGEEFLVLAPALRTDELDALAARLLLAIAGTPVALPDGTALRVTTSIGHARVPLPPHAVPLRGEQAINLVDMALYLAKGQGRNRAVGIHSVAADSAAALQALEADFERGCSQGQVVLRVLPGPSAAPADPMAAHPAHPGGPQGQPQPDAAHSV
ncbi:MAG: hypothetical protein CFE45_13740 [Burkholderiales bacterium PBB5]|nr:MAG: hypothetical protein CFE45_13740 [Burkholderiales bacterium PBB5]